MYFYPEQIHVEADDEGRNQSRIFVPTQRWDTFPGSCFSFTSHFAQRDFGKGSTTR